MKPRLIPICLLIATTLSADLVLLNNGKEVSGTVVSLDQSTLQIAVDGIPMSLRRSDVQQIHLGNTPEVTTATNTPSPAAAAPNVAPAPTSIVLPANTPLTVSIQSELASNTSKPGQAFQGVITANVMSGATVVIPAGSQITGTVVNAQKAGRGFRKTPADLELALTAVNIQGTNIPIQTMVVSRNSAQQKGEVAKGAARGAALGAIGGAIGDDAGQGAAMGAAMGATAGFVQKGDEVAIPAGSVLMFQLKYPVSL